MSYIVRNCPCIKHYDDVELDNRCMSNEYITFFCENNPDCIIKQVIEKCKENLNSLETYIDIRSYECTMLQDILDLFDIEEIMK